MHIRNIFPELTVEYFAVRTAARNELGVELIYVSFTRGTQIKVDRSRSYSSKSYRKAVSFWHGT